MNCQIQIQWPTDYHSYHEIWGCDKCKEESKMSILDKIRKSETFLQTTKIARDTQSKYIDKEPNELNPKYKEYANKIDKTIALTKEELDEHFTRDRANKMNAKLKEIFVDSPDFIEKCIDSLEKREKAKEDFKSSERFKDIEKQLLMHLEFENIISDNPYKEPLFGNVSNKEFYMFFDCKRDDAKNIVSEDDDFPTTYFIDNGLLYREMSGQGTDYSIRKLSNIELYEIVSKNHRESLDTIGRKKSLKYMLIESCETCNLRASSGTCGKDIETVCAATGTIVDKYWRDHDNVRFPEDCPLKDYAEKEPSDFVKEHPANSKEIMELYNSSGDNEIHELRNKKFMELLDTEEQTYGEKVLKDVAEQFKHMSKEEYCKLYNEIKEPSEKNTLTDEDILKTYEEIKDKLLDTSGYDDTEELLPCPFCGEEVTLECEDNIINGKSWYIFNKSRYEDMDKTLCYGCCNTDAFGTKEETIKAWHTRNGVWKIDPGIKPASEATRRTMEASQNASAPSLEKVKAQIKSCEIIKKCYNCVKNGICYDPVVCRAEGYSMFR